VEYVGSWLRKLVGNSTGPAGNERDIQFMTHGSYILVHHMWPDVYYLSAITKVSLGKARTVYTDNFAGVVV
jgi:hypothetical protein